MIKNSVLISIIVFLWSSLLWGQTWRTERNTLYVYPPSTEVGIGINQPRGRLDLGAGGLNKNLRIGNYLDIGETDYSNFFYLGINSILSSSSISNRYNAFKPNYALGQGLVMVQSGGGQGNLDFYGIDWNGSFSEKQFPNDFTHIIRFNHDGRIGIGTDKKRGMLDLGNGGLHNNVRIGDYLDIGETDYHNVVYFGINAVLSASNISGGFNRFKPAYAGGQGMVLAQSGGGQGNMDIYGINWDGNEVERNFPDDFSHVIRFSHNGQVGIGTTAPTHELTVNGVIKAEEIIVGETGADFVFDDDYPLRSLEDVERFIQKNKHLPDIPPAEKIQKSGARLGELQNKLLQKIEELTLYLIELKKADSQQTELIELLKKENSRLKQRITSLENFQ